MRSPNACRPCSTISTSISSSPTRQSRRARWQPWMRPAPCLARLRPAARSRAGPPAALRRLGASRRRQPRLAVPRRAPSHGLAAWGRSAAPSNVVPRRGTSTASQPGRHLLETAADLPDSPMLDFPRAHPPPNAHWVGPLRDDAAESFAMPEDRLREDEGRWPSARWGRCKASGGLLRTIADSVAAAGLPAVITHGGLLSADEVAALPGNPLSPHGCRSGRCWRKPAWPWFMAERTACWTRWRPAPPGVVPLGL